MGRRGELARSSRSKEHLISWNKRLDCGQACQPASCALLDCRQPKVQKQASAVPVSIAAPRRLMTGPDWKEAIGVCMLGFGRDRWGWQAGTSAGS